MEMQRIAQHNEDTKEWRDAGYSLIMDKYGTACPTQQYQMWDNTCNFNISLKQIGEKPGGQVPPYNKECLYMLKQYQENKDSAMASNLEAHCSTIAAKGASQHFLGWEKEKAELLEQWKQDPNCDEIRANIDSWFDYLDAGDEFNGGDVLIITEMIRDYENVEVAYCNNEPFLPNDMQKVPSYELTQDELESVVLLFEGCANGKMQNCPDVSDYALEAKVWSYANGKYVQDYDILYDKIDQLAPNKDNPQCSEFSLWIDKVGEFLVKYPEGPLTENIEVSHQKAQKEYQNWCENY